MAPLTTWRIGGPAELLATPATRDDVATAVRWAAAHGVPLRILGNGSNLLVRDEGVAGIVLRVRRVLDEARFDGPVVTVGAGASFPAIARAAASRGLAGLEFGTGIPGTIGGALRMNAGWHEHEIGSVVEKVEHVGTDGTITALTGGACRFAYRTSAFEELGGVILQATLRLEPDDPDVVRQRLQAYGESRKAHQPTHLPSCGSVFVKPPGDFAGRLIDEAGLKGTRVGGIEVSTLHANFFVNVGNGNARDVLELVRRVETAVRERFGVALVREFEVW